MLPIGVTESQVLQCLGIIITIKYQLKIMFIFTRSSQLIFHKLGNIKIVICISEKQIILHQLSTLYLLS